MTTFVIKNLADNKYYTLGPTGYVEYDTYQSEPPKKQRKIFDEILIEPPKPFHVSIKTMDLAEFCMQKDAFNDPSECAVVFTDIFYSGYYKQRPYFLNATYVCESSSDLYHFSRYLDIKRVVSQKPEVVDDENTILINPGRNYDASIFKNVIYTTILGSMPQKFCDAICSNTSKSIYIEPNETGLLTIPMDFMMMSNDIVYMANIELSQDDTFRSVFGHLMKTDLIRMNQYLFDFISQKYIAPLKNFFQVNIYYKTYKGADKLVGPIETTTGNILFEAD
jgi:hypothetical protein